jgi:hypothetical protein
MSASPSELVALARLNGDFQRNYGRLIGAFLYLRSISAAGGRTSLWAGLLFAVLSAALTWLEAHLLTWLHAK